VEKKKKVELRHQKADAERSTLSCHKEKYATNSATPLTSGSNTDGREKQNEFSVRLGLYDDDIVDSKLQKEWYVILMKTGLYHNVFNVVCAKYCWVNIFMITSL